MRILANHASSEPPASAREAQLGLVAQADGGTLFLDEVDSLSTRAQIALLRFLEDGSYRPLGAKCFMRSAARVIAATNADLEALVESGAFRKDLFFRLSIVPVFLPPLRERAGDAALLAQSFLQSLAEQRGAGPSRIDRESLRRLDRHDWPGNVRELFNVIQRAFLLAEGDCISIGPGAIGVDGGRKTGFDGAAAIAAAVSTSFRRARAGACGVRIPLRAARARRKRGQRVARGAARRGAALRQGAAQLRTVAQEIRHRPHELRNRVLSCARSAFRAAFVFPSPFPPAFRSGPSYCKPPGVSTARAPPGRNRPTPGGSRPTSLLGSFHESAAGQRVETNPAPEADRRN